MSARTLALLAAIVTAGSPSAASATPFAYTPGGAVIDTATDTVVGSVSGIVNIQGGVAMNPAGTRVYMLDFGFPAGNGLKVVDTASNSAIATVPAVSPFGRVAVSPSGTRVYTADPGGSNLVVIDGSTNAVITTVPLGASGSMDGIAVHPDGSRVDVSMKNALKVVDTATNAVVATVAGLAIQGGAVAVNPSGTRVYASNFDYCGCGGGPTRTAIIDTATNLEVGSIPVYAGGLAINSAGTRMYAADGTSVHVIDLGTNTVVTTVPGFSESTGIAVNPAGTKVYVIQRGSSRHGDHRHGHQHPDVHGARLRERGRRRRPLHRPVLPWHVQRRQPVHDGCLQPPSAAVPIRTTPARATTASSATAPTRAAAGTCARHAGDPCTGGPECADACNEAADNCFDLVGTPCTSDGNVCTDDQCNGAGACVHPANTAPCDDGLFCTATDTCAGGTCGGTPAIPARAAPSAPDACNEAADDCFDLTGTACTADANPARSTSATATGAARTRPATPGQRAGWSPASATWWRRVRVPARRAPRTPFGSDGTACDDADPCTSPDECVGGACTSGVAVTCAPLARPATRSAGASTGLAPGARSGSTARRPDSCWWIGPPTTFDEVKWEWWNGPVTTLFDLGDPRATDAYALCVYDADSTLLMKMLAPAGGACGRQACWNVTGPTFSPWGYRYRDCRRPPARPRWAHPQGGHGREGEVVAPWEGSQRPHAGSRWPCAPAHDAAPERERGVLRGDVPHGCREGEHEPVLQGQGRLIEMSESAMRRGAREAAPDGVDTAARADLETAHGPPPHPAARARSATSCAPGSRPTCAAPGARSCAIPPPPRTALDGAPPRLAAEALRGRLPRHGLAARSGAAAAPPRSRRRSSRPSWRAPTRRPS